MILPTDLNYTILSINLLSFLRQLEKYKTTGKFLFLLFIRFLLNGLIIYITVLQIKVTKTIYRCTFFGFISIINLVAILFGELICYNLHNYFFLIGTLNIIGIFAFVLLDELNNIPNMINDLKKMSIKKDTSSKL
jgi:hypothetical protein